ncbi:voltage-dependent calcium channel gamma-5 subunit-like isoform X1 [Ostrea edulis]|uniref:voltage-dependent calcium channel gamma-5 subunit-like isoform X1 n=1 Tax=Ostrea edulis TaxID=37623 RepID=UPI002094A9D2|nr:voltage-dependent calcium channel gamma-5 subunit-like isoform X1 [Ostrea edulis]
MYCGAKALTLSSFVLGAISIGTLSLSVATDSWLFTEEDMDCVIENITVKLPVKVRSGLFRFCTIGSDEDADDDCVTLNINLNEERLEERLTSTSIMRANRVSTVFPIISLVLLVIATTLSVIGNIKHDVKTLISSGIHILSGLMLAVGIILYISAINDEVGHRPKPSEADDDTKKFDYEYGWSFFFAGTSFLLIMTTAVILVSLYLQRNSRREDLVKIIPGLGDMMDADLADDVFASNNPTIIL